MFSIINIITYNFKELEALLAVAKDQKSSNAKLQLYGNPRKMQGSFPLSQEKEKFIAYVTSCLILSLKFKDNEKEVKITDTRNDMAWCLVIDTLNATVWNSDTAFFNFYHKLKSGIDATIYNEFASLAQDIFLGLISGSLKPVNESVMLIPQHSNEKTMAITMNQLFNFGFGVLSILNSVRAMHLVLEKNNLVALKEADFFQRIFYYPCYEVIQQFLKYDIPINQMSARYQGDESIQGTPLAFAIMGLLKHKNLQTSQKIITELLKHGADVDAEMWVGEQAEVNKPNMKKFTIRKYCEAYLAEKHELHSSQIFQNDKEVHAFKQIMKMIVQHKNNTLKARL